MEEKKIKICALTTISKTMDWFIVDSMRNLAKNGYDVTLICNMDEAFIKGNSDFAKCIPLEMSRGASVKDLFKSTKALKQIFKREKFDVLYYTSPNASMYAALAGKKAKIKTRVYSQCGLRYVSFSGIKRFIFKTVEKITCSNSTHIRAQSPMNMQFAIDEKLCKKDKISVVGIGGTTGVDLKACDAIEAKKAREELRDKYGIPQDAFVYGYVGRINKDKGINELIEAFAKIEDDQKNVYLMLVGMKDDGNPITDENMAKAEEDARIVLTGNVPKEEVYRHMSVFDVLVHPTYREGFGKVLQEGMGMRLPIITTNVPGPSEVVGQGEYGILVEAKNVEDLAAKMSQISFDEERRRELSEKGRARAEQYFDRPIMLNNILEDMNLIVKGE
ncbi:MAG: glycosyltransferase family 4 protein [Clostridia bacterium]|nr:glycosyltransferase family 4 protein [Clostridia bacterium]